MKRHWKTAIAAVFAASLAVLLAIGFSVLFASKPASAANPTTVSFQGKVVNSDGTNVTDGTYSFLFKLYTVSSGGTAVWSETDTITVASGVFQVNLGVNCSFFTSAACNNSTPIDFSSVSSLYLGMTFNSDAAGEMTPRVQMQSVPYAYYADSAGKVGGLSASQLVQLSPGSQQSGFINVSGNITSAGTIQGGTMIAGAINATTSGGTITTNLGTLQRVATGLTNVDLKDAATTTLQLLNSGSGVANFNLYGGDLQTGTTPTTRLTNAGALTNLTGYSQSSGNFVQSGSGSFATGSGAVTLGGATTASSTLSVTGLTSLNGGASVSEAAAATMAVAATGATRTADIVSISNVAGQEPTTDGVNALQLSWLAKPATGALSSAERINVTNKNTAAAGQVQALRLVATGAGGAVASDTVGLYIDALTGASTGTPDENAIEIGTGWDNLLNYNGTPIINGTGQIQSGALSGSYANALQLTGATNTYAGASAALGALNATSSGGTITTNLGTLQRTATGVTNIDLKDAGTTTLQLWNSGTGVANLNLYGGDLQTGATPITRLTNAGNLTNIGNYTATGSFSSGYVADTTHTTDTATTTYTNATAGTAFYISTNVAAGAVATSITTVNLTGLPAVDGTVAFITIVANKIATTAAATHSTAVQIAGTTLGTVTTTPSQTAASAAITHNFTVVRMNGVWRVVGSGLAAAVSATVNTAVTADYAEWIPYSGDSAPQAGDIVAVGDSATSVKASAKAYDTTAIGVVSTDPYQVGGADDGHSVIMALTGRVPVKVNLQNGAIQRGDKITSSSTAGIGMRANKAGHIIGTALSDYDGHGDASVTVQLAPGYDDPQGEVLSSDLTTNGGLSMQTPSTGSFKAAANLPAAATGIAAAPAHKAAATSVKAQNTNDFTLTDAAGQPVVGFHASGDASISGLLKSGSIATGGLSVAGDADFAGLTSFEKLATFLGKVIFKQDVQFDGHVAVGSDNAGYALLRKGESSVHVSFDRPYQAAPIVSVNGMDGTFVEAGPKAVSVDGFDVVTKVPAAADTTLSWTAVGSVNPKTTSNPITATAPLVQ